MPAILVPGKLGKRIHLLKHLSDKGRKGKKERREGGDKRGWRGGEGKNDFQAPLTP